MVLKRRALRAERDFNVSAAGGMVVAFAGEMKGVAGERCVASTLLEER